MILCFKIAFMPHARVSQQSIRIFFIHTSTQSTRLEELPFGSFPRPKLTAYRTAYDIISGLLNVIVSVPPTATPMRRLSELSGVAIIIPDA